MAQLPMLGHAPDIVLIATGAKSVIADVTKTYFAAEAFFRLDSIAGAVKDIAVGDYFDRLALDRALDTIGDAERRITTAMIGNGAAGAAAVEKWAGERGADVERIRAAIQEIAASGLTISKLTVAASMLGDLARR
jgi:glutamate dehydrogenase